jgi:methylmalonyl-CoA mutase N-terminal domain/subunit
VAGSYYIESLTSRIEQKAQEKIAAIEAMGGAVVAIERGYIQQQIQETAFRYQTEIESGVRAVVGVNKYADGRGTEIPLHRLDLDLERAQVERVRALRANRDAAGTATALQAVEETARGAENLLPRILDAVEARATLGEIADTLRKVFTTYRESSA